MDAHYGSYFSLFPFLVRVPVPLASAASAQEAMHSWARATGNGEYAASPFRNYDDPSLPSGTFSWHFRKAEAAAEFAERFSGKLIEKR